MMRRKLLQICSTFILGLFATGSKGCGTDAMSVWDATTNADVELEVEFHSSRGQFWAIGIAGERNPSLQFLINGKWIGEPLDAVKVQQGDYVQWIQDEMVLEEFQV